MKRLASVVFSAVLFILVAEARAVTIDTVPVGNVGNANDPATGGLYGGVAYNYSIGTYDVTNSQYAEFLNTKDPSGFNTLGLWNSGMANATFGGISLESGNAIGSKYALTTGRENQPVNYVNWYEAVRFVNWLNNGQGNSSTENGAYKLGRFDENGVPINGEISRNAGAKVFLPNKDEWYKAAYYNPATNSYFQYPTSSNDIPLTSGPTGLPNHANASPYGRGNLTDTGGVQRNVEPVRRRRHGRQCLAMDRRSIPRWELLASECAGRLVRRQHRLPGIVGLWGLRSCDE